MRTRCLPVPGKCRSIWWLSIVLFGTTFRTTAEPAWLCPSYHIVEVTRLHYGGPNQSPERNPFPIGLNDSSQVFYSTWNGFPAHDNGAWRYWLWQPQVQLGRPAGTSLLLQSVYRGGSGPIVTGVTSDGRFAEVRPTSADNIPAGLRWWNGNQWSSLVPTGTGTRYVTPSWVLGVNENGDVAFNYNLIVNAGLPGGPTNLSRAGFWSGSLQNWQPIFPEDTTRAFVLSMNSQGTVCGVYRSATAPGGTPHRGFTATYGTTPIDFVPVGTIGGYSQTHGINDAGEIVGVTGTQGGGVRPFIYLPAAAHGLTSGLNEIGPTMPGYTGTGGNPLPVTARLFINNRGQVILTPSFRPSSLSPGSPTNNFLWQRGQSWPLAQLADVSGYSSPYNPNPGDSPWFARSDYDPEIGAGSNLAESVIRGFNDRGEILIDTVLSYDSPPETLYDEVVLLFRPKLTSSLALDQDRIAPGTTNKVRLRLLNEFTADISAPGTPTLHWDGPGAPVIVNGPTLASTNASWSPGVTNEWVWTFYFTNETKGIFVAQGSAGTNNSMIAEGSLLKVQDQADLWVRRTNDSVWKGDDIYAEAALPSQTREMAIQPTETAAFQIRLQNDSERARALTVKATASSDPGWLATYKLGVTDISSLITNAGYNTATLATGEFVDFNVALKAATNALDPESRIEVTLLGKTVGGTNGADVVKIAASVLNNIIVNTTGDEADANLTDGVPDVNTNSPGLQTTLRCAIDFANRREGADLIKFEIPANDGNWVDGLPQIEPATALPDITETVVIDGWTQNTNATTPPVALSGKRLTRPPRPTSPLLYYEWPGAIPALTVRGEACELRGLIINQFPTGVELAGAGSHVIEGCFFGLSAAGDNSLGNGANGGGSLAALRDPNGYSQSAGSDFGWEFTPSFYDYRYVNWIANYGSTGINRKMLRARGWDLRVTSPQNRIGGETLRQRNRFGSVANFIEGVNANTEQANQSVLLEYMEFPRMIWIDGVAAFANTVIGSTFGVKANEHDLLTGLFGDQTVTQGGTNSYQHTFSSSIHISDAPGTMIGNSSGGGNLFALGGISLSGSNCIGTSFFGNYFGLTRDGNTTLDLSTGINAKNCGFVQIGGLNTGEGNLFAADWHDIDLVGLSGSTSRVLGNRFWTGSMSDYQVVVANLAATEVRGNTFEYYHRRALWVGTYSEGNNTPPAGTVSVINNIFNHDRGTDSTVARAIDVTSGRGHTIVGNIFTGPSDERMIIIKPPTPFFLQDQLALAAKAPPLPNDDFDLDGGPNNRQNWPVVATALLTNGQLMVQAGVDTGILSGQYQLHVYRCFPDQWYHGQPQELVATGFGNADASGRAAFIAIVPAGPVAEGDFLCATATGPDGSTSEVGPVRRVIGGPDSEADGMGNATENRVPNRASAPGLGDGNGDGVPDSQQSHVTSLPAAANQWLTLAAPAGYSFSDVDSSPLPITNAGPDGFTFPVGLVSFTLNDITPGGTVTVTNIIPASLSFSNVFAFGPTPGNTQPHWYELNFTRTGDELRLNLTDGNAGDHDLAANGSIATLYAPSLPLPPEPRLTLLNHQAGPVTGIFMEDYGTNIVVTTNIVTLNRAALAWPAVYTNLTVEYTDDFSFPVWKPAYDEAVIIGDQLVITNMTARSQRFYRLVAGAVRLFTPPAPLLTIQNTSTNTLILSWPSWGTGFSLQQSTNLVTGTWASVTNPVSINGGFKEVVVPPVAERRFYRLKSP